MLTSRAVTCVTTAMQNNVLEPQGSALCKQTAMSHMLKTFSACSKGVLIVCHTSNSLRHTQTGTTGHTSLYTTHSGIKDLQSFDGGLVDFSMHIYTFTQSITAMLKQLGFGGRPGGLPLSVDRPHPPLANM